MNPKYPVYVVSKGRHRDRKTSRALEKMGVPYLIAVEPQEYAAYCAVIDPARVLKLPFSNLGLGSIPARNFVWEHAVTAGHARHWCLDDNIWAFSYFTNNQRNYLRCGTCFRAIEDWADRFSNVALAGMQYDFFCPKKEPPRSPLTLNTRVYSVILINSSLPFRWRGRYNEDTDLSLRALKAGWCTALFNVFLAKKTATMLCKGGNTDELYKGNGRLEMALSLQRQHPDVVKVGWKWGRPQHVVNYRPFRANPLTLRPGVTLPTGVDNYGLVCRRRDE